VLSDLKATLRPGAGVDKQVLHPLVVNLKQGDVDLEAQGFGLEFTHSLENLGARNRHDANVGAIADLQEKADVSNTFLMG